MSARRVALAGTVLWQSFAIALSAAPPLEEITAPFPALYSGALAWGDYDNDGDLDLAALGSIAANPWTAIYQNQGSGVFTQVNTSVQHLRNGGIAWGDYDRDGDLDLAMCGLYSGLSSRSIIYRNDGHHTFTDINATLPGCYNGTVLWGDYDNDGDLDLFMNGETPGARLYRNDNGLFVHVPVSIGGLSFGSASSVDFDNDGRLDLMVSGFGGNYTANAYRNVGNLSFVPIPPFNGGGGSGDAWTDYDNDNDFDLILAGGPYPPTATRFYRKENGATNFSEIISDIGGVTGAAVAWCDYDNDGFSDFFISGQINNNSVRIARLYHNETGGVFSDAELVIPGMGAGAVAWGDFDNDRRTDLALFGHSVVTANVYARLYRNTNDVVNSLPTAPLGLGVVTISNSATFSWAAATDSNQTGGLTYNLRVGTAPGRSDIISPMADATTGFRRIAQHGNTGLRRSWTLTNLALGTYYWSVQAIDHSLAGGLFAPEQSFFVVTPVLISDIPDQMISISSATTNLPFVVSDSQFGADAVGVRASSSNTNLVPNANIVFGGAGSNRTVRVIPVAGQRGIVVITVTATNANAYSASDSFTVLVDNLRPSISAIPDQTTAAGVPTPVLSFTVSDPETPASNLVVIARSSNTNFVPHEYIDLDGTGTNRTVQATPLPGLSGSTLIAVTVSDADGGSATEVFQFNSGVGFTRFAEVPTGIIGVYPVDAAWGDYDGDGDLDVLLAGTVTNSIHTTRLYRNDAGVFAHSGLTLPAVTVGSVSWADIDGDSDLDFVLAGYTGSGISSLNQFYNNIGNGQFIAHPGPMPVQDTAVDWADFDGDGDLDLLMAGGGTASVGTRVYRNNGAFTFSDALAGMPATYSGAVAWGDYNADGFPDAIVTGFTGSFPGVTYLYRNTGAGPFASMPHPFPTVFRSAVAWGDYDNDGDLDLFIGGSINFSGPSDPVARIYRNEGNGAFVDVGAAIQTVIGVSAAWGDYDNDSDLDLVICGRQLLGGGESAPITRLYRNDDGAFTNSGLSLPGVDGKVAWGDYDNDGDLDLLLVGNTVGGNMPLAKTILLQNEFTAPNVPPTPPQNLSATVFSNTATFSWTAGTDANQPSGLTYNLRVGTAPGRDDIVSAMARADGRRLLPKWGNTTPRLSRTVRNLPFGFFYWSVQTIDHAYAGSSFAPEASFHINRPPVITDLPNITLPVESGPTLRSFTVSDDVTAASNLVVTAASSNTNLVAVDGLEILGEGSERVLRVTLVATQLGSTTITVTVRDDEGGVASDSFVLTVVNTAPTLAPLFDRDISYVSGSALVPLTVGDAETSASNLTVTASSLNTNFFVAVTGDGSNRVLTISWNPGPTAASQITVRVTDPLGLFAMRTFRFATVNFSPAISALGSRSLYPGTPLPPIPFTVSDPETPANDLLITVASLNTAFIPTNNIAVTGSGTNRFLNITPVPGQMGFGQVQLTVRDSLGLSAQSFFALEVRAFSATSYGTGYGNGFAGWFDFDNDDDLDFFIAGSDTALVRQAVLYRNNGGVNFSGSFANLIGIDRGSVALGDIDNDGDVDLLYSGAGSSGTLLRLYRNNNALFGSVNNTLTPVLYGSLDWGDFDNDGDLDLLLTGLNQGAADVARVYRNNGTNGFSDSGVALPGTPSAGSSWGDYNGDGHLDILLVRGDGTRIFRNNANETFTDTGITLPGVMDGMAAWGDYDNDGDLDIAISGLGTNGRLSRIYRNDGPTLFTDINAGLAPMDFGAVVWGDFNNDGWLDLVLMGINSNQVSQTLLYFNNGNETFLVQSNYLGTSVRVLPAAGDFDRDGDLDLIQATSSSALLLRNNVPATNRPPAAPGGLSAAVTSNSVILRWNAATDDHQTGGLSYNVRVGTMSGSGDVLSAMANASNGFRRIARMGNAGERISRQLVRLQPGIYFWSVQAIDHAYLGSAFASESTFVITNVPPRISAIPDQVVARNRTNGPIAFTIGDLETFGSSLLLRGVSSDTNLVLNEGIVFGGFGSNRTVHITPTRNATGEASITLIVEDAHGGTAQTSFNLRVLQAAPDISDIGPQFAAFNTATGPISFTISDLDDEASTLTVTGYAANTNLVPGANFFFGGNSSNRTLTLTPALNQHGTTIVFITVTDAAGASSTDTFLLNVVNNPPIISSIPDQAVLPGAAPLTIPFTIGDAETAAEQLNLEVISSNTNLLPVASMVFGGSASNRSLTLNPVSGVAGVATITVTVRDAGSSAASEIFQFRIEQFTDSAAGIANLWWATTAWGDFDNDGDPDLLVNGRTANNASDTRLYRNDGSNAWARITNGVPSNHQAAVCWGDFDNDGWLDFLHVSGAATTLHWNTSTNAFVPLSIGVTSMWASAVAPGDFDNDGRLDFAVAGSIGAAGPVPVTRIYRNVGGMQFVDIGAGLPGVYDGTLAWADLDRDGDLDLALCGTTQSQSQVTFVLRNDSGAFTDMQAGIVGVSASSLAWGDFNNDGFPDLLLAGSGITRIYRNNSGTNFTSLPAGLPGVQYGSASWGDLENDGDLDILLAGVNQVDAPTRMFVNNNGVFTDIGAAMAGSYRGAGTWADFDKDGDLDALVMGSTNNAPGGALMRLYRNNAVTANTLPAPPTNSQVTLDLAINRALFSWSGATDAETPSIGLTYALRVGTNSGGTQIVSPHANTANGYRRVVRLGDVGSGTRWAIEDLPVGEYFWGVQSVDNAFAGSAFTPEQSFVITNARPVISSISNVIVFPGVRSSPISFTIGDVETPAESLSITGFSSDSALIPPGSIEFSGVGSNRTVSVLPSAYLGGTATITVRVTDAVGSWRSAAFIIAVEAFSVVTNLVPAGDAMVTWGDVDGDADLDLIVAGYGPPPPGGSGFVRTQLYRNDNGRFVPSPTNNFAGVTSGAAEFGDADNDGDLDLLLAGRYFNESSPFFGLYRNNGPAPFSQFVPGSFISPALNPMAAWGDADNDGDFDLLVAGRIYGSTPPETILYRNNGNGVFSNSLVALPGVFGGSALWADYDNDGDQDILLTGRTSTSNNAPALARIYRNENGTNFVDIAAGLPDVGASASAWGDFDRDGDLDLALCGLLNSNALTRVYRNNGGSSFTDIVAGLPGVSSGSVAWGDYDNDGWLDLLICGTTNGQDSGAVTRLYRNNHNGTFSDARSGLPDVNRSSVAWGDYDGDGNLDLVVAGAGSKSSTNPVVKVFRNNTPVPGMIPGAPAVAMASVSGREVMLRWAHSPDRAVSGSGVSGYNLRLINTNNGRLAFSPQADASGFRRVVRLGNAGLGTNLTLRNLAPGHYEWRVQSIGHNYAGSPFTFGGTFAIANAPPVPANLAITTAEDTAQFFQLTGSDPEGQPLSYAIVTTPTNGTLSGTAPFLVYRPATNYFGPDGFTFSANDSIDSAVGTVTINVVAVPDANVTTLGARTLPNGDMEITLRGEPWQRFVIEASANLLNWTEVDSMRASPGGVLSFTITPGGFPQRFYRARITP